MHTHVAEDCPLGGAGPVRLAGAHRRRGHGLRRLRAPPARAARRGRRRRRRGHAGRRRPGRPEIDRPGATWGPRLRRLAPGAAADLDATLRAHADRVVWATTPHVRLNPQGDRGNYWTDVAANDPARVDRLNEHHPRRRRRPRGRPIVDLDAWAHRLPNGGEFGNAHRLEGRDLTPAGPRPWPAGARPDGRAAPGHARPGHRHDHRAGGPVGAGRPGRPRRPRGPARLTGRWRWGASGSAPSSTPRRRRCGPGCPTSPTTCRGWPTPPPSASPATAGPASARRSTATPSSGRCARPTSWRSPSGGRGGAIGVRHVGLVTGTGRFMLRRARRPARTRLTWDEDLRFPWWLGRRAGAVVAAPALRAVWRGNLRRFAALVTGPEARAVGERSGRTISRVRYSARRADRSSRGSRRVRQ